MKFRVLAALGAALALCVPAFSAAVHAQSSLVERPEIAERGYIRESAWTNLFAIQSSDLALETSTDEAIRDFARRLGQNHATAQAELEAAVTAAEIDTPVPTDINAARRQNLEQLQNANDTQFDLLYLEMQRHEQEQFLSLQRKYAADGNNNASLRGLADSLAPVIEGQVADLRTLEQERPR